ncbi:CoA transferase subunit A [Chloroflexota bacterium]
MSKIYDDFQTAVEDIPDGATVMMHSFTGSAGITQNLIEALRDHGTKNLTVISCSAGPGGGIQRKPGIRPFVTPNLLIISGQVRKFISSWTIATISSTSIFKIADEVCVAEEAIRRGELEWEPVPQGILTERIHAGAAGLGGFYSPVGIGTLVEQGKEKKVINGREYLLEKPLRADYAFVRAYKADKIGNLIYRGTARSFNPLIAMAADVVIAEVDDIVELGEIDPEHVITPGVFVDRIVKIPKGGWK